MFSSETPLIIGHRGASASAPENTLAAFARALDDGADGIELDVRPAADRLPVVIHDATLKRTRLRNAAVGHLTLSELAATDAGTWFNRTYPAFANDEYARECVPTLEQVFQLFLSRTGPAVIYVELKTDNKTCADFIRAIIGLINRLEIQARAVIVSFDLAALELVKQIDPSIRTGALFAPRHGAATGLRAAKIVASASACGATEILLHRLIARPRLIKAAIASNLRVVVWTVDDPEWIRRAKDLGVHALITNNPALLLKAKASLP